MKKYIILVMSLTFFSGLYLFGQFLKERQEELIETRKVNRIEIYKQRIHECSLAFPKATANELHECATD